MARRLLSFCFYILIACACTSLPLSAAIYAGTGKCELTPKIGTPSAGYAKRQGRSMEGVHDPLLATVLVIDNGNKMVAFCGVDNLGFTYEMTQEVIRRVHQYPNLVNCEVYLGSSHTHSGGGAFLNIPKLGELLAGTYEEKIAEFYISSVVNAICTAGQSLQPALIGIGYGHAENLSLYRSLWPIDAHPLTDVAVIKVTKANGAPLAVLFNYPLHPVVLGAENLQFSADFVGYARDQLQTLIGPEIQPIYFNGAQGEISPNLPTGGDRFALCESLGKSLAKTVADIWKTTKTSDALAIDTLKESYNFIPQPTPHGLELPIDSYASELNILVMNHTHAFITIPGELSCVYDARLKAKGKSLGLTHVSILGLVNDAHGYILLPEAWRRKTAESGLSFGGEDYGDKIEAKANRLLETMSSTND